MHTLSEIISGGCKRANPNRALKKASHGLAKLYGFKPICFINDNFRHIRHHTYCHDSLCTPETDCILLSQLITQLRNIHSYATISDLKRSRYDKYVRIYGVSKYYHPRKIHYAKNMRNKLSQLSGKRCRFTGTYIRFGHKQHGGQTVLVINIKYHGKPITEHVWMTATKPFRKLRSKMPPYTEIAFDARVKAYQKGQISKDFYKHIDYSLQLPTKIKIIDDTL